MLTSVDARGVNAPAPPHHLWHVLFGLVFMAVVIVTVGLVERLRDGRRTAPSTRPSAARAGERVAGPHSRKSKRRRQNFIPRWLVGIAGLGAAGVHIAVSPEHFGESWMYGTFFVCLAIFQIGFSVWIIARPSTVLFIAIGFANLATLSLWAATRTLGVPVGPGAGSVETIGMVDLLASCFEILVVLGALAAIIGEKRRVLSPPARPAPTVHLSVRTGAKDLMVRDLLEAAGPPPSMHDFTIVKNTFSGLDERL
jgi:hypothetical protein